MCLQIDDTLDISKEQLAEPYSLNLLNSAFADLKKDFALLIIYFVTNSGIYPQVVLIINAPLFYTLN